MPCGDIEELLHCLLLVTAELMQQGLTVRAGPDC
jgi:hypothetical protein